MKTVRIGGEEEREAVVGVTETKRLRGRVSESAPRTFALADDARGVLRPERATHDQ